MLEKLKLFCENLDQCREEVCLLIGVSVSNVPILAPMHQATDPSIAVVTTLEH